MRRPFSPLALALVTSFLGGAACSPSGGPASASADAGAVYLGLEPPKDGFQVRTVGTIIPAGGDEEYCEVAELPGAPGDTYYVKSIELGNGDHSHHLIVTAATPGSAADKKLRDLSIGDRVACLSGEQAFGEAGMEGVSGIQAPYGNLKFPEGVGRIYHGGQRVVFDYHYFNSSDAPVHALSAMNLHLTDEASVKHYARGFGFYNWTIDTPAGKTGSFTGECTFENDVNVSGITRHTHRWGTDYSVWFHGGARDGEHVWTSKDWQHDVDHAFDAPIVMKAGEGFRFQCNYDNTEDHELRFGTQASDEMCILFGLAWNAGADKDLASQSCDITWTDADGIGHSPKQDGGPPKPSDADTQLCLGGSAQNGATPDACSQCRCDSCATPIIACVKDPECNAILGCFGKPGCDIQAIIDEHSSAAGMATAIRACIEAECGMCSTSGADAGN